MRLYNVVFVLIFFAIPKIYADQFYSTGGEINSKSTEDTCSFQTVGDPNGDHVIDIGDLAAFYDVINRHIYPGPVLYNYDYDGNCVVNSVDLFKFQDYLGGGWYSGPPVDCTCLNPVSSFCCLGRTGNIDDNLDELVDVADIVYLIEYQYKNGPAPPCLDEADVDGERGIDVGDLVYMIDYQFKGGDEPVLCWYTLP